jgi:N-acylneuraminate cytidylyltransferase
MKVLIPARAGSVGLKDKNKYPIEGHPLIGYSVLAARALLPADQIWVSTDSTEYRDIAREYGAHVPFLRPEHLSTNESTDLDVFRHAIHFEASHVETQATYWIHLRPTSPVRSVEVLQSAVNAFRSRSDASSLRSVHRTELPVLKWMRRDSNSIVSSLCGDTDADSLNLPRQTYPEVFIPNGYIDIVCRDMITRGRLHGDSCLAFDTPVVPDIDTIRDIQNMNADHHRQLRQLLVFMP